MLLFISWAIVGFAALGVISDGLYDFLFGPNTDMWPVHIFTSIIGGFSGFFMFKHRWDKQADALRKFENERSNFIEFDVEQVGNQFNRDIEAVLGDYLEYERRNQFRINNAYHEINNIRRLISERIQAPADEHAIETEEFLTQIEFSLVTIGQSYEEAIDRVIIDHGEEVIQIIKEKAKGAIKKSLSITYGILSEVRKIADDPLI